MRGDTYTHAHKDCKRHKETCWNIHPTPPIIQQLINFYSMCISLMKFNAIQIVSILIWETKPKQTYNALYRCWLWIPPAMDGDPINRIIRNMFKNLQALILSFSVTVTLHPILLCYWPTSPVNFSPYSSIFSKSISDRIDKYVQRSPDGNIHEPRATVSVSSYVK